MILFAASTCTRVATEEVAMAKKRRGKLSNEELLPESDQLPDDEARPYDDDIDNLYDDDDEAEFDEDEKEEGEVCPHGVPYPEPCEECELEEEESHEGIDNLGLPDDESFDA